MDFDELNTFIILAQFKNFTKTAEECHVVQSTVSNRIKNLEKFIGKKLFRRDNKTVVLTDTGKVFLEYAKRLTNLHLTAMHELYARDSFKDIFNIGTVHSIYDSYLSKMLKKYLSEYNMISTNLIFEHSNGLYQMLHDDVLDIAFTYYKIKSSKFITIPYIEDNLILVTSSKNNTYVDGILKDDIKKLPLIYSDIFSVCNESWFYDIFQENSVCRLHTNIMARIIPMVKMNIGYCFLPRLSISSELEKGELIEIKILDVPVSKLQSYMVINKRKLHSLSVTKWLECNFPEWYS